jgi:hypothetical protein
MVGSLAPDFVFEVGDDLRAALVEPLFRGSDTPAVLEQERVGEAGIDVGFGFVVVGGVRRPGVTVGPWAEVGFLEMEEGEQALAVLLGREVNGRPGNLRSGWENGRSGLRRSLRGRRVRAAFESIGGRE